MNLNVQEKMQMANFDTWTAFRADKEYYQHCVPYGNCGSYSAIEGSAVIKKLADNGHDYFGSNSFTIEKHQTALFEYLVERDGFVEVDSHWSNATYVGNGDDTGGYYPVEYPIPKSITKTYRRKEGFLIGHIQSKLHQLQLSTGRSFTLRKASEPMLNAMSYKLIVDGEHRMSVNKNQTDAFFHIINEQFITSDGEHYYKK